jgi:arylformamidase
MRTYDISLTLSMQLPTWPGDPPIVLERFSKMEEGAMCNVTRLSSCVHVGTHVDAPYHFMGNDALTVEDLPLNMLTGRAYVLELDDKVDRITASILEKADVPSRTRRLLIKTRNSQHWTQPGLGFQSDFVAISGDGAQYLVERGVRLVGVDYLSVAPFDDPAPTHQALLGAGVVVVEGLNLSEVSQGRYTLYCLPLKIAGADGAPARAILVGV